MQLDLEQLIKHPQTMDKETLYDLRSLIALYPYFQTARLLMLQNLYILHDPSFDEELRKAAIYITDRKMIFRLIAGRKILMQKLRLRLMLKLRQMMKLRYVVVISSFQNMW